LAGVRVSPKLEELGHPLTVGRSQVLGGDERFCGGEVTVEGVVLRRRR
jgi:hypothetical protein